MENLKLHRHLLNAALEAYQGLLADPFKPADRVIEWLLKSHPKWGARDRHFVAETVYGMIRWHLLLEKLDPANHQNGYSRFVVYWSLLMGRPLPEWTEFEFFTRNLRKRVQAEIESCDLDIKYSFPNWLTEKAAGSFENQTLFEDYLRISNQIAPAFIRRNRLKGTEDEFLKVIEESGIKLIKRDGDAYELVDRARIFSTPAFQKGWFEVQDLNSQQVSLYLDPKGGQMVIDACAGAGGKTLHLASLMGKKGQIIAMDIHTNKLQELTKRLRRGFVHNAEPRWIESHKTIKRLQNRADKLLLDVPCTGSGVFRRNPDSKIRISKMTLEQVMVAQQEILTFYPKMVKKGGDVCYATCSILKEENQDQVQWFLNSTESGKSFRLEKEQTLHLKEGEGDGFYMALLKRVE